MRRECWPGKMMADSLSEEIAVIGNTDLTPSELENNIRNTVKTLTIPLGFMGVCRRAPRGVYSSVLRRQCGLRRAE